MIKQQEKNLDAHNQAIEAQQQLPQSLNPKQHSTKATNKARPRPRPRTQKMHHVQQTCKFASMQAQGSITTQSQKRKQRRKFTHEPFSASNLLSLRSCFSDGSSTPVRKRVTDW